ncbi:ATPase, partial [Streptomyces lasiicapitis]
APSARAPAPEPAPPPSDALPRRVRHASLAPQLRERPAATEGPDSAHERSPERVRTQLAAYRDGWARGGGRPPGSDSSEGDPA